MGILIALLGLVAASAVVSFVTGAFIRSRVLAITSSVIVTELLFLLLAYCDVAASSDAPEIVGVPGLLAIVIAPIVLLTSFIFVALACRLRERLESRSK